MDFTENINKIFSTYLDKAIRLSIIKEKHNGIDFLYVKTLNSLDTDIRKQLKKPAKVQLKKLVEAKFENLLKSQKGQEIHEYYKNEKEREVLVKSGSLEEVKAYLNNIKYKRDFLSLMDGFITTGNIPIVKMIVESPINKKQTIKIDYNHCIYAVDANNIELFDYFRGKIKRGINPYLTMCATRAIDGKYYKLLTHILSLGKTEIDKLLIGSIIDSDVEMQSFLVDKGAKISNVKKILSTCGEQISQLEAYRLNLSLQEKLSNKPLEQKVKI